MTVVACGRNIVPVHQGGSWRKGARVPGCLCRSRSSPGWHTGNARHLLEGS